MGRDIVFDTASAPIKQISTINTVVMAMIKFITPVRDFMGSSFAMSKTIEVSPL